MNYEVIKQYDNNGPDIVEELIVFFIELYNEKKSKEEI